MVAKVNFTFFHCKFRENYSDNQLTFLILRNYDAPKVLLLVLALNRLAWPFLGIHCFAYGLCPTDDRSYVRRPSAFSTIGLGMMAFMKGVRRRFSSVTEEEIDYMRNSVRTNENTKANMLVNNERRSTIAFDKTDGLMIHGMTHKMTHRMGREQSMSFQVRLPKRRVKRVRFADQLDSDENEFCQIGERIQQKLKKRSVKRKLIEEVRDIYLL